MREKAEHQLIDEVRDLARRTGALQTGGDGREPIRRFLGEARPCLLGAELVGVKKDRMEDVKVPWFGELIERELVDLRNFSGPMLCGLETCRCHRRLVTADFPMLRRSAQAGQALRPDCVCVSCIPKQKILLPDLGETIAASRFGSALFKRKRVALWIGRYRIVVTDHGAKVVEMRVRRRALRSATPASICNELLRRHR
jgi:hypothetical protein